MEPTQIIEALLFASDAPLTTTDIASADESLDEAAVAAAVHALRLEYDRSGRAFQIVELAGGFQILTRPEFAPVLERFETVSRAARLSTAALEALAIVAYRQPIGRAEIEEIRGVGSSGVLRTLQEHGLITPVGRAEGLGRPLLYGTTPRFLEHFAFRSLEDLPRPEDLPVVLRERTPVAVPDSPERADGAQGAGADSPEAGVHTPEVSPVAADAGTGSPEIDPAAPGAGADMHEPGSSATPAGAEDAAGVRSDRQSAAAPSARLDGAEHPGNADD